MKADRLGAMAAPVEPLAVQVATTSNVRPTQEHRDTGVARVMLYPDSAQERLERETPSNVSAIAEDAMLVPVTLKATIENASAANESATQLPEGTDSAGFIGGRRARSAP